MENVQGAADAEAVAGTIVEGAGWVGAATGQEYLDFLIPLGAGMSGGGTMVSAGVDYAKGDTKSVVLKAGSTILFGALSGKIDALKTVNKIAKLDHTILGATNYAAGKIGDKMVEKATEKKEVKEVKTKPGLTLKGLEKQLKQQYDKDHPQKLSN